MCNVSIAKKKFPFQISRFNSVKFSRGINSTFFSFFFFFFNVYGFVSQEPRPNRNVCEENIKKNSGELTKPSFAAAEDITFTSSTSEL